MISTMRIVLLVVLLLPTIIVMTTTTTTTTMVAGFQTTKVSFVTSSKASSSPITTNRMMELSLTKQKTSIDAWNTPVWMEQTVQVVSTVMIGWTLATSMAMADTSMLEDVTMVAATTTTTTTTEAMIPDTTSSTQMTESAVPTMNTVAVEAMLFNTGTYND